MENTSTTGTSIMSVPENHIQETPLELPVHNENELSSDILQKQHNTIEKQIQQQHLQSSTLSTSSICYKNENGGCITSNGKISYPYGDANTLQHLTVGTQRQSMYSTIPSYTALSTEGTPRGLHYYNSKQNLHGNNTQGKFIQHMYQSMDSNTTRNYLTVPNSNCQPRYIKGEERFLGVSTMTGDEQILSERVVEHEIKVPKRIVREEVIEKTFVVPQTIRREEVVDEVHLVKETIVEIAKPIIREKIIEVPFTEYRDKIVHVPTKIFKEKVKEVPRIIFEQRNIDVPKYVTKETIIEVPQIEYKRVPYDKIIEIPEIRENIIMTKIPVPQYIKKPVAQYVDVPIPVDITRNIPVPVEAITTFEYQLPQVRPRVNKIQYPVYVPRFIEVPVSAELFEPAQVVELQSQCNKLSALTSAQALGLADIENLATDFRRTDVTQINVSPLEFQNCLKNAWKSGRIIFQNGPAFNASNSDGDYQELSKHNVGPQSVNSRTHGSSITGSRKPKNSCKLASKSSRK